MSEFQFHCWSMGWRRAISFTSRLKVSDNILWESQALMIPNARADYASRATTPTVNKQLEKQPSSLHTASDIWLWVARQVPQIPFLLMVSDVRLRMWGVTDATYVNQDRLITARELAESLSSNMFDPKQMKHSQGRLGLTCRDWKNLCSLGSAHKIGEAGSSLDCKRGR